MQPSVSHVSEMSGPPGSSAITGAEYGLWRANPPLAWALRHGLLPEPACDDRSRLGRVGGEIVGNRAAVYLRQPGRGRELFGEDGRFAFLQRYVVPGHWEVRADALFMPRVASSGLTLIRVSDVATSLPGERVRELASMTRYHLAYQRFTLRRLGLSVTGCGVLHFRGGAAAEALVYEDLTDVLEAASASSGVSINDEVAAEATKVREFLQRGGLPVSVERLRDSVLYAMTHRADGSVPSAAEVDATLRALGVRERVGVVNTANP